MEENSNFWINTIDDIKIILYDIKKLLTEIDDAWNKMEEIEEKIEEGSRNYGKE